MSNNLIKPPQAYCGDVVGTYTYGVMCFGYVLHAGVCIYLNVTGPATGTLAVLAQMQTESNPLKISPLSGMYSTPINSGARPAWYHIIKTRIEQVKMINAILTCEQFYTIPEQQDDQTVVFVMERPDDKDQAMLKAKVLQKITKIVDIPIAPQWGDAIYKIARDYGLVYPVSPPNKSVVTPKIWAVRVRKELWQEKIIEAVSQYRLLINN